MSQMRKMVWSKLKSPFGRAGISKNKSMNNLVNKFSTVDEEYTEAFRTKSYIEICSKVQGQLGTKSLDKLSSSSSSSLSLYVPLSESLLQPRQETVINMIEGSNLYHLLANYFEASLEACHICELLLKAVHQTRINYKKIKRVIKLTRRVLHHRPDYTDNNFRAIFGELSSFASLKNPLSIINGQKFHEMHDGLVHLLQRLTSKRRKVRRRARLSKCWKKIAGFSVVISCSAISVALLVLALHGMVGMVAAPGLIACCLCLVKRRSKLAGRGHKTSKLEKLSAQLEVAAKGVYIWINDLDTMTRLVRRLHDETEHSKALADMCVRKGKSEVLKEVVREFRMDESCFLEQLEELEEHINLCFLTINRSRMLVLQEITVLQPEPEDR
ncbi:hypothetical protein F0562_036131 [Nyssa sinensis]|uniref:Uncharacterized protein n=1 Tax=Nyssa sinensis TaxID=561372 RepID=A0A5J5AGB1_9ASTE|nr:hypothetical protein F0562_036131 [Nyssa sinensis]